MKEITQIAMQKHSVKHCNIYLDNVFYCSLRLETVVLKGLKVGQIIDEKTLAEMQIESEFTHALDRAMTYLTGSVKTKKQVRDYLVKKGYTEELVLKVLEKLEDYRFLNDEAYAERYTEVASGQKGKYLIERELRAKGIDESTAKKVLEDFADDQEVAFSIAQKDLKGKEINKENLAKVYRKLLSKGFSYEMCTAVIDRLKQDLED